MLEFVIMKLDALLKLLKIIFIELADRRLLLLNKVYIILILHRD